MPLDRSQQISKADAGHQNHDADFAGHHPVGKIDRAAIRFDRDFPHRWTDVRDSPTAGDHPCHVVGPPTFESGDRESFVIVFGFEHRCGSVDLEW